MAKRQKTKAFSFQGFDAAHYKTTAAYTRAVNALFDKATSDIAEVAHREDYDPDKPFDFDDYPKAKAQLQKVVKGLASQMQAVIETGSRRQWLFACHKNDEFIASIIDTTKLTKGRLQKMQDRNLDALQSFQARKVGGMSLAERVWKYTEQYKAQIELGLDVGLGEGRSAQQLSRDLRQNLQDPNRLFRRVRDKRGNLQLSKAAKAFHPGQGVYRSSYKNAMRLTRSEINMAYREADHLRWQQLDFVVGFEVHRSNHEPKCKCDLCERLVGKYPKYFKFKGWHPQCLCYATAILMDEDDFDKQELSDLKSALKGTEYRKLSAKNEVTELPEGFKDWVAENETKQANWASTPYFIKDNFVDGILSKGVKFTPSDFKPAQDTIAPTKVEVTKQDPFMEAIDAMQADISNARTLATEWGIKSTDIDTAIQRRDVTAVKIAIMMIKQEASAVSREYAAYMSDASKTISEAKAAGVDAKAVQSDVNALVNKSIWSAGKSGYNQRLQQLKDAIIQSLVIVHSVRSAEQQKNEAKVAALLGVKQGEDMTFEEANDLRGNPNFERKFVPDPNGRYVDKNGERFSKNGKYKKKYTVNCQSCVVANELRRRGMDVEALGNTKERESTPYILSTHTELAWLDDKGNTPKSERTYGFDYHATMTNLNTLTEAVGRYHIKWQWSRGGGHIITCERLADGTLRIYDPQTGQVITNFEAYAKPINLRDGIEVLRVDTLQINTDIIAGVVTKTKTKEKAKRAKK